jgi:PleD family two-component response regulator
MTSPSDHAPLSAVGFHILHAPGRRPSSAALVEPQGGSETVPTGRGHVLIVEDNPTNQKVAALILTRAGLRVDVASNGLEAVEAFRTRKYDVLLMDCQMPEMTSKQRP